MCVCVNAQRYIWYQVDFPSVFGQEKYQSLFCFVLFFSHFRKNVIKQHQVWISWQFTLLLMGETAETLISDFKSSNQMILLRLLKENLALHRLIIGCVPLG